MDKIKTAIGIIGTAIGAVSSGLDISKTLTGRSPSPSPPPASTSPLPSPTSPPQTPFRPLSNLCPDGSQRQPNINCRTCDPTTSDPLLQDCSGTTCIICNPQDRLSFLNDIKQAISRLPNSSVDSPHSIPGITRPSTVAHGLSNSTRGIHAPISTISSK